MPSAVATSHKKKKDYPDIVVVSENDDSFVAKIFEDPEPFTFSRDCNGYLQYTAFSGEPGALNEFLFSLLDLGLPDDADEDDIDQARFDMKRRFKEILVSQKGLSMERLVKFTVNLIDIAGNARTK